MSINLNKPLQYTQRHFNWKTTAWRYSLSPLLNTDQRRSKRMQTRMQEIAARAANSNKLEHAETLPSRVCHLAMNNLRANSAKRRSGRKPGARVTNFVVA